MTIYKHTNTASAGDVVRSEDWNAAHTATAETQYWSCPGTNFHGQTPDVDNVTVAADGSITANANGISFRANVNLPHGATVTKVIVYGNAGAAAENYHLVRGNHAGWFSDMAAADINVEDTSITNAEIDNEDYIYLLRTSSLDNTDRIYGGRITYTI